MNYNSLSNSSGEFSSLPSGNYSVSVTDQNSCNGTNTINVTITTKQSLSAVISASDVSCYGMDDGTFSVSTIQGGNGDNVIVKLLKKNGNVFLDESIPQITNYQNVVFDNLTPGIYKVSMINLNIDNLDCNLFESGEKQIIQPDDIIFEEVSRLNETCKGANDGEIVPVMQGGNEGFSFYTSINGNPWKPLGLLSPGTYFLKSVKGGCEKVYDSPIYIEGPVNTLDFNWISDDFDGTYDLQCEDATTSITLVSSGGWENHEYSINNGPFKANNFFEGLTANVNYNITVKDSEGCIVTKPVLLSAPEPISANFTIAKIECHGEATGVISIEASGGYGDYEYKIDNGSGTPEPIFENLVAGDHFVTIDDGECPKTFTVNIPENEQIAINFDITHIDCFEANNGSISTIVAGGVPPYNYSWTTGKTESFIDNLTPGTYGLTVTDVKGCQFFGQVEVVQPDAPLSVKTYIENVTCNGNNDGKLHIVSIGGTEPYQYSIDNGNIFSNSSDWTNLTPGFYQIVCKDNHGCLASEVVEVKEPDILETFLKDKKDALCFGTPGALTIGGSGGNLPYLFSIDNEEFIANNGDFNEVYAGSHSVTLKDSKGCESTVNVEITQPGAPLVAEFTINNVTCKDQGNGAISSQISGGTPPYSIEWDNDIRTSKDIDELQGGTYTITIHDTHDCVFIEELKVDEPSIALSGLYEIKNVSCYGLSDGGLSINGNGGYGNYQYSFDGGEFNIENQFVNLKKGVYAIEIKDVEGCIYTDAIAILEPDPLSGTLKVINDVSCFEGSNGKIEFDITGGTPPYKYLLVENNVLKDTPEFDNLPIGNYVVEVEDSNGCILLSNEVEVKQPSLLAGTISDVIDASCGQFNGSAKANIVGGVPPYSYKWLHNHLGIISTDEAPSNLKSGIYEVVINDSNNCSLALVQSIDDEDGPVVEILNSTDATCFGSADGQATVAASGGSGNYTYLWSSGETYPNALQLIGGEQFVEVKDDRGCSAVAFVQIGAPELITISIVSNQSPKCFDSCDGEIKIEVAGGEGPYTYEWLQFSNANSPYLTGICAGSYDIIVTDANGCQRTEKIILEESDQVTIEVTEIVEPLCNGFSDGSITVIGKGGQGDFTYQWNDATLSEQPTLSGIKAGIYSVYVEDKNGCSGELNVDLFEPDALRIDLGDDKIICANQTYLLDASISNGIYKWYMDGLFVGQNKTLEVSDGANYKIDVLDEKGCPASDDINITQIENSLEVEFLGASEIGIGDSLQLVDVSWEIPDSLSWDFGNGYSIIDADQWSPILTYSEEGVQKITLTAYLKGCIDSLSKEIILHQGNIGSELGRFAITKGFKEISVYPNPTDGKFTITIELFSSESLELSLFDMTGEIIDQQKYDSDEMFTKDFNLLSKKQGVYLVQAVTPSEVIIIRVFIR